MTTTTMTMTTEQVVRMRTGGIRIVLAALAAVAMVVLGLPAGIAAATAVGPFTGTVDSAGASYRNHSVTVTGRTTLTASLTWAEAGSDLSLFLKDAAGAGVTSSVTASRPEQVLWVTPGSGTYTFGVKAQSGVGTYSINIDASAYVPAGGESTFGGTLAAGASATHDIAVDSAGLVVATLDWADAAANLNMFLRSSAGAQVAKATNLVRPEILAFRAPAAGAYSVLVQAPAGGSSYSLRVEHPAPAPSATPTWQRDYGKFGAAEVSPVDMQKDLNGDWWVIDEGLACVRKYGPDRSTVKLTVFTCGDIGSDATHISRARGLGLNRTTGEVWIADTSAHRLLKLANDGTLLLSTNLPTAPGGALNTPGDVAVDDDGNAYVHDQKDRIVKVSPTGGVLGAFGSSGFGAGAMRNVMSIEFSAVGGPHLYTTDSRNYQVDKWTTSGVFVASYGKLGTADGQLTKDARGIAVDASGTIYVADVGGNRIVRFTKGGVPLPSLGNGLPYNNTGGLDLGYGARGLYVDGSRVAVADMWNARVLFWTLTGEDTGARIGGGQPSPDSHLEPRGVARDNAGNVYVSDYWHQWIQKFAPDGTLLAAWGKGRGSDPGTLNLPGGIEVDNTRGFLYIANREERMVDRWRLSDGAFSARFPMPAGPADPKGWPRDVAVDEASGRVYAADEKNNQVVIFTAAGAVERILTTGGGARLGQVRTVEVGPDGLLYVGDGTNRKVHVYTVAGEPVRSFGVLDSPNGISVTGSKVYVLSFRVLEYSLDGAFLARWSSTGTADGQLRSPYVGIVATPGGDILVGDSGNHRVKVFRS